MTTLLGILLMLPLVVLVAYAWRKERDLLKGCLEFLGLWLLLVVVGVSFVYGLTLLTGGPK